LVAPLDDSESVTQKKDKFFRLGDLAFGLNRFIKQDIFRLLSTHFKFNSSVVVTIDEDSKRKKRKPQTRTNNEKTRA
jgi:hypothetical protein